MNASRLTVSNRSGSLFPDEIKPGFRTKTAATRFTPAELSEVESAAENAGQPLSKWLRETALRAARQRPADPNELLLSELWAVRYTLLSLFHAGALATAEGKALLPDSVLKIRDQADARKAAQAHKLMTEFLAQATAKGGR